MAPAIFLSSIAGVKKMQVIHNVLTEVPNFAVFRSDLKFCHLLIIHHIPSGTAEEDLLARGILFFNKKNEQTEVVTEGTS